MGGAGWYFFGCLFGCWLAGCVFLRLLAGSRPGGRVTFFASPKKRRATSVPLRGPLRYSKDGTPPKRLRRLPLKGATPAARQSRFRGVPGRGCASRTSPERLVRCAHLAGVGAASFLTPHFSSWATTRVAPTPLKDSGSTPTSSFRAQSRNPCPPALQHRCCDYAQHDGMCRATLPPSPTPFPLISHPPSSLLPPPSSLLPPPSSLLIPHSSLLTPHPSPLTPHSSLLSSHPNHQNQHEHHPRHSGLDPEPLSTIQRIP